MEKELIEELGLGLYAAYQQSLVIEPITNSYPDITIKDAYSIQLQTLDKRLDSGEKIIGKKIGVTSSAVMNMLGVAQPDFGHLTDKMLYEDGAEIKQNSFIQPKAEGEIAFVLKKDLMGPGVTIVDVLNATEGVMACCAIVDSRIRDWDIKIQDTVADNASCGAFVLASSMVSLQGLDVRHCGMVLEKNGEAVVTGAGAASMNSPVNAVVWLANTLGQLGIALKAGEIILSGALGAMVPITAGDNLRVSIAGIGSCSVRFS